MGGEKKHTRHLRMNHERNTLSIIPATAGPSKQPHQCGKTGKQSLPGTALPQHVLMLSYLQIVFTSVLDTHQGIKVHCPLPITVLGIGGSFWSYFGFYKSFKPERSEWRSHVQIDTIHPQKTWERRMVHLSQQQTRGWNWQK